MTSKRNAEAVAHVICSRVRSVCSYYYQSPFHFLYSRKGLFIEKGKLVKAALHKRKLKVRGRLKRRAGTNNTTTMMATTNSNPTTASK